jgi:hypothetical protein
VEYNCAFVKVDWLAALRVVGFVLVVSFGVGVNFRNPLTYKKQGLIPEKITKTLQTNKKQGILDKVHASNIIS